MKRIIKWLMKPQQSTSILDNILHIEDDYYFPNRKESEELSRFYLAQV